MNAKLSQRRVVAYLSVLVTGVAAGCGLGAVDDYAPLALTDNFRILEAGRAYRSAQLDASTLKLVIGDYGIRTIINLRGANPGDVWYDREQATAQELGVRHIDIPMSATRMPPREVLLQVYDALTTAEYPLLIHCQAGADRTGAVSAIYRMVVQGQPRAVAAQELSPAYGHFAFATPAMDRLVAVFQPDRGWIETQYDPKLTATTQPAE